MYWHFLVKNDVGLTFLYQFCSLCPYEEEKTNISPKNLQPSFWQFFGLEHTLLRKLTHIHNICTICNFQLKDFKSLNKRPKCKFILSKDAINNAMQILSIWHYDYHILSFNTALWGNRGMEKVSEGFGSHPRPSSLSWDIGQDRVKYTIIIHISRYIQP